MDYYSNEENLVQIEQLLYGDFLFKSEEIEVAFEYKTVDDFLSSIDDRRVFNQALTQSNNSQYHFIILVGTDSELEEAIEEHGWITGHWLGMQGYNGVMASLVEFTSVLRAPDEEWAFDLMERVATKCLRDKPIIHRFPKSRGTPAYRLLNNVVNGVGEKKAEKICSELCLNSADSVFNLTIAELVKVDGIGKKSAEKILSQLKSAYS